MGAPRHPLDTRRWRAMAPIMTAGGPLFNDRVPGTPRLLEHFRFCSTQDLPRLLTPKDDVHRRARRDAPARNITRTADAVGLPQAGRALGRPRRGQTTQQL